MTTYIPRKEVSGIDFTISSDFTGSNGDANRQYSLAYDNSILAGMQIVVNQASLQYGSDYTYASGVVTFLVNIFDNQVISIDYNTTSTSVVASTGNNYATTLQVFEFLQWVKEIPEFVSGSTPVLETVDDSGTLADGSIIYLDHNRIIDGTQTISYGADATSVTALTETTHYTIGNDLGKITITAAGATAIGANNVYASYKYIELDGCSNMTDSYVDDLITRATALFDGFMNRTYQTITQHVREEHTGKGRWGRRFRPLNMGIHRVVDTLTNDETVASTTFELTSTSGLSANDYMTVGTEVISIDSVDTSTQLTVSRGQLGTTAATHAAGDVICNAVFEISNTPRGSTPNFTVQEFRKAYEYSNKSHLFTIQDASVIPNDITFNTVPGLGTANRVRITYSAGSATIPTTINQACIEQVCRWITSAAATRELAKGNDSSNLRASELLSSDVREILSRYKLLLADGF